MGCTNIIDISGKSDAEVVQILKKIFAEHKGRGPNNIINAAANKPLLDAIFRLTSYFDADPEFSFVNLTTRCYMLVKDLKPEDFPRCEYCGKIIQMNAVSMKKGFPNKTCSSRCAALNPARRKKVEQTNLRLGRHPHWSNWEKAKATQAAKTQEQKDAEITKRQKTI